MTIMFTDGDIENLWQQEKDLRELASGENHMMVMLVGHEALKNLAFFESLGVGTCIFQDLNAQDAIVTFLNALGTFLNDVCGCH